jgi:hypothetical protein
VTFTPFAEGDMPPGVEWHDRERLSLDLTTADSDAFDDLTNNDPGVEVLDWTSGHRFHVRRAPCDGGCYCAAEATWVRP